MNIADDLDALNLEKERLNSLYSKIFADKNIKSEDSNSNRQGLCPYYKIWPDTNWPPKTLFNQPHSEAVSFEAEKLFAEYYEKEKDNWD